MINPDYEIVIGLEVHAQLLTDSKLFCGDRTSFAGAPNTHVSPITLGHPGTLPRMNRKAIEYAVKMGLACDCTIASNNHFARKHYFYPDLPKGYQVSQHTTPICVGGAISIKTEGITKSIRLNRIHLEEDAGKSMHDIDDAYTSIDYNRAGTPLIEIVSEPDLRSGDEAFAYVNEVRKLVRYLDICDGNMEEGSLRCDANVSVRKKGDTQLGTKVEVKNLNSARNVKRAIDVEADRLIALLEIGGTITQQTRSFDASNGTTFAIRDKEDADDYRYFAEPDLTPFQLADSYIESVRAMIPALPAARVRRYTTELNLSEYDAGVLTEERSFAERFEELIGYTTHYKAAANWMSGPVRTWLNENNALPSMFPVPMERLAQLIQLVESGKVSFSVAAGKIFPQLIATPGLDPEEVAVAQQLLQQSDTAFIEPLIDTILSGMPDKVAAYRKGKKGLLALFVGEVMKQSKGKADPKLTNALLLEKLKA